LRGREGQREGRSNRDFLAIKVNNRRNRQRVGDDDREKDDGVKACIHRGSDTIGGSCVELREEDGGRLLLDLGLPLGADDDVPPHSLAGLDGGDPDLLGIVISHSHPDHYGLIDGAPPEIPVYMGAATARILKEAKYFTPMGLERSVAHELVDRLPLPVGPFTITPFLVDHSAFDSYALLVEADGRRLFYSGDLRAHGRKPGTFRSLLAEPPEGVDAFLLEGTTISRSDVGPPVSEAEVETRLRKEIREADGMLLACYSAQNIDRLVSVYRAAIREGRDLIIDLYGAAVAAASGRSTVPQADWERVRVYVPQSQRVRVKSTGQFWRVNELGGSRIYAEEIVEDQSHWVMSFRTSMAAELERAGALQRARAVWTMWPGYLEGDAGERTLRSFRRRNIPLSVVHASGHASVRDLQGLAAAIGADEVVPIHTPTPEAYAPLFDRVVERPDGRWWEP
jgi:ribonuclease J